MSQTTEATEYSPVFMHYAVGTAEGCEDCPTIEEEFFSWSSCSTCQSGLGGTRYPAHEVYKGGDFYHVDICQDCQERFA